MDFERDYYKSNNYSSRNYRTKYNLDYDTSRENYRAMKNANRTKDAMNRYKLSRRKKSNNFVKFISLFIMVLLVAFVVIFGLYNIIRINNEKKEFANFSTAQMKQDIYIDFSKIGINDFITLKGKTKQEVYDTILGNYKFNIKIHNSNPELDMFEMPEYGEKVIDEDLSKYMANRSSDNLGTSQEIEVVNPLADITIEATKETYLLPDFLEGQIKTFIDTIYDEYLYDSSNKFDKKNVDVNSNNFKADFEFVATANDAFLDDCLLQLARLWDTIAVKGQIESFDYSKNEFTFGDDHKGYVIDQNELRKRIINEVNKGNLNAEIWTVLNTVDAEGPSVKSRYRYVSVFETETTDNEKRNKNIQLACEGINGLILKPSQEFSFNKVLGERTEERGYDYAPAYLEGQVVEELGGGICQVSSTLYNAVFEAGLTTTYRKSHTFEPTYITPGLDATVSFHGPDYRFINNSNYSVGIRANYSRRKVKIEIFAVPLLKEGQTVSLYSNKIQDLEFPSLSIITEGEATKGTQGSEWQVFKVVREGEKIISRDHDHYAKYQGHTPTAYEEFTYTDEEGVLKTRRFVESIKIETTESRELSITTVSNESSAASIAPEESTNNVRQVSPNGNASTGQPQ